MNAISIGTDLSRIELAHYCNMPRMRNCCVNIRHNHCSSFDAWRRRCKTSYQRRSQGCSAWVYPQGGEKCSSGLIYRKMCKCTPRTRSAPSPSQSKSQYLGQFLLAGFFGGIFRRSLRATTKKGRQLFWPKSAPPDKILATPMSLYLVLQRTLNRPMDNFC